MRPGAAWFGALRHGSLPGLLAASAGMLVLAPELEMAGRIPALCGSFRPAELVDAASASLSTFPVADLAVSWILMVLAMMPPLAAAGVNHVVASSIPQRRSRALALLLLGYCVVWASAGAVVLPLAAAAMFALGGFAMPVSLAAALVWMCSPVAAAARGRCHRLFRIALRGWPADRDCLLQGAWLGAWCVISCWLWMLPLLTTHFWHGAAMAMIGILLLVDRFAPGGTSGWSAPSALAIVTALLTRRSPEVGTPAPRSLANRRVDRRAGA
jgi:predicted metal-binding membrane protein